MTQFAGFRMPIFLPFPIMTMDDEHAQASDTNVGTALDASTKSLKSS
jgi:hypothetical protein